MREHSTHFALVAIFIYTPCVVVVSGGLGLPNRLLVITHNPIGEPSHPSRMRCQYLHLCITYPQPPIKIFAPDSPVLYIERDREIDISLQPCNQVTLRNLSICDSRRDEGRIIWCLSRLSNLSTICSSRHSNLSTMFHVKQSV
jgi:hypothetical protein